VSDVSFRRLSPHRMPSQTIATAPRRHAQPAPRTVSGLTASLMGDRLKPGRSYGERFAVGWVPLVERDLHLTADRTLIAYAATARSAAGISV
jgi:hypothetical protein